MLTVVHFPTQAPGVSECSALILLHSSHVAGQMTYATRYMTEQHDSEYVIWRKCRSSAAIVPNFQNFLFTLPNSRPGKCHNAKHRNPWRQHRWRQHICNNRALNDNRFASHGSRHAGNEVSLSVEEGRLNPSLWGMAMVDMEFERPSNLSNKMSSLQLVLQITLCASAPLK